MAALTACSRRLGDGAADEDATGEAPSRSATTPFFRIDGTRLVDCYAEMRRCFPSAGIYYALKANPEPFVLTTLAAAGARFEAASWQEIELLLNLGVDSQAVLFGTAVKSAPDVIAAAAVGVDQFAADSLEELQMLSRCAPAARVLLRARVDDSSSVFQMSEKFGARIKDLKELLTSAAALGLRPWGLSFNVGSQSTSAGAWAAAIRALLPVVAALDRDGIRLDVLDLGGGFPTRYASHPHAPKPAQIAESTYAALREWPYRPFIILEPGRALVAASMTLTTSVIARIERETGPWLYLDAGVYNALFEALSCQGKTRYRAHCPNADLRSGRTRFTLAGPTGDGLDVIARDVTLPSRAAVGDRLIFDDVGAYTLSMASAFNGFPKPSVLCSSGHNAGARPPSGTRR